MRDIYKIATQCGAYKTKIYGAIEMHICFPTKEMLQAFSNEVIADNDSKLKKQVQTIQKENDRLKTVPMKQRKFDYSSKLEKRINVLENALEKIAYGGPFSSEAIILFIARQALNKK